MFQVSAAVRAGGEQAVRALADHAGVTEASARHWLDQPGCDEVLDRLLATLRRNIPEPGPLICPQHAARMP